MPNRIPDMGGLTRLSDAEMDTIEAVCAAEHFGTIPKPLLRRLCAEVRLLRAIVGADTLARMDPGEELMLLDAMAEVTA